jgi:gentisate 1,2-dioxygenase
VTATDEPATEERAALGALYADFAAADMAPSWTRREGVIPMTPEPAAVPMLWRWSTLHPWAARSGELVPVGCGGKGWAIALVDPGLPGTAYATPMLWAAIQYLGPREEAPAHRHTRTALRFVVEGQVTVGAERHELATGDLFAVPSWAPLTPETDEGLDAFRFSNDPVFAALGLARTAAA